MICCELIRMCVASLVNSLKMCIYGVKCDVVFRVCVTSELK